MSSPAPDDGFLTANPHALATILQASETRHIIASRDIFDVAGVKLWARDQPVSKALQRKLLDRQLRDPIETCLLSEDSITTASLVEALQGLIEGDAPLAAVLRPHGARLLQEAKNLPLHPVAQLLLTAGQAARPESYDHALQAMALCGVLMITQGSSTAELRLAMLGGLLHDLGEMYIDPRFGEADAERNLDFQSYQQLVVHPHVGRLILTQLTNYPAALARAVAEHHERMDGSGYPHALRREAMSPLGRMLAVAEGALARLRGEGADWSRASVALRVVPSEYDLDWVGAVAQAAKAAPPVRSRLDPQAVQARLARLDEALRNAHDVATALAADAESAALSDTLKLADYLIGRLRAGWFASGLWSSEAVSAQDAAEVEAVEDELFLRLRSIERAALLRAGELPPADAARLEVLCAAMRMA